MVQKLTDAEGKALTGRPEPLTYYHAKSPVAEIIRAVRSRKEAMRVAVIGLGFGSLACYFQPGEEWRFFEIDPAIVDIARDHPRFGFVRACTADVPIVLGDARLTLAREPDHHYDLIDDVAVGIAGANGMKTWVYEDDNDDEYIYSCDVAISASKAEDLLGALALDKNWKLSAPDAAQGVWTDDYSNLIGAVAKRVAWPSLSLWAR